MKKTLFALSLCIASTSTFAQSYFEQRERQELQMQHLKSSMLAYQTSNIGVSRMSQQQQQARRVRGTVYAGNNQIQVFLYVVYNNNGAYVTSYWTGQRDMNGQEITSSVQSYAQKVSYQYDGELSRYYEWKISIGNQSTGYQTCYF